MKKGDIVIIKDGSFSRSVVGGELIHELLGNSARMGDQYMVVEIGCVFPNTGSMGLSWPTKTSPGFNNTVIQILGKDGQSLSRGKVVFIEERFLKSVNPIREVTMAEVCAQFGEDVKVTKD